MVVRPARSRRILPILTPLVILASGTFDGVHSGHVRYLRAARLLAKGEFLRVAVAPDVYIRTEKHREPYWSQSDRAETVLALGCVDCVTQHPEPSVAQLIRDLRPRLFVKGQDWRGKLPEDVLAACQAVGTEIVFVDTPGKHVSQAR